MQSPSSWGPHYWAFLHTVALGYPVAPTEADKKRVYALMHALPHWIPHRESSLFFAELLDKYPLTPYLDTRASLVRWTHFVHNRVNEALDRPEQSIDEFYAAYLRPYRGDVVNKSNNRLVGFGFLLVLLVGVGYGLYRKSL